MIAGDVRAFVVAVGDERWVGLRLVGDRVVEELSGSSSDASGLERLRDRLAGAALVSAAPRRVEQALADWGLERPRAHWDVLELAALLVAGANTLDLAQTAARLGFAPPDGSLESEARLVAGLFGRLLGCLAELDHDTLGQVCRLAAPLRWPLRSLFVELERHVARAVLEGGTQPAPPATPAWLTARPATRRRRAAVPTTAAPGRLDPDEVVRCLMPGGSVAAEIPGYEPRAEQAQMAREVAEALNDGERLLVEAGTGTGKSLAYLLPTSLVALRNNWRVVVSTATTTLQDQLYTKDLPLLRAALGSDLRVSVLKGRANYLCVRRWQATLQAADLSPAERHLLIKTLFWAPRTRTGDRAELRLSADEEAAWQRVCASVDACTPAGCAYHRLGLCFVARARRAAEDSHVVIVNHALLLSDLAAGSRVLPDYEVLVVDEAHHLEQEATDQLGWRIGPRELGQRLEGLWSATEAGGRGQNGLIAQALGRLRLVAPTPEPDRLGADLARAEPAIKAAAAVRAVFEGLAALLGSHAAGAQALGRAGPPPPEPSGGATVRVTGAVRAGSRWQQLEAAWEVAAQHLREVESLLAQLRSRLDEWYTNDEPAHELALKLGAQLEFFLQARQRLSEAIQAPAPDTVYWLSGGGRGCVVHAAPLVVADTLRAQLFDPARAVIVVSATLAVGGSFAYVQGQLGLDGARGVVLGSPFDFERTTLLYVPNDLPDPTQPGYQPRLDDVLADVIAGANGRTLVLFTSRAQLRASYAALREPLRALGVTVLGQGLDDASRTHLLELFRRGGRVALFGPSSFWEGIDVVGDALSCVAVTRLPFAVPTDPMYTARAEQFDDPFAEFAVPGAVLRLKQGFGRLIRSRTDRGVVVVLDRRLVTRSYGRVFVSSLPTCSVEQGPAHRAGRVVADWLARRDHLESSDGQAVVPRSLRLDPA
jgi:Rad3-related DNA helicase